MSPSDEEIMRRVQAGECELFDVLVRRYRLPLTRVALSKFGDAAWAEDLVQEALLAAYAARGSYAPQYQFRTWLWTILLNLCRRHYRRRALRPREVSLSGTGAGLSGFVEPASDDGGLSSALWTEEQELLQAGLARLPDVQADALRLRYFGELKFDEIALAMGCSLSAAKVRVYKGLAALAQTLKEEEGTVP